MPPKSIRLILIKFLQHLTLSFLASSKGTEWIDWTSPVPVHLPTDIPTCSTETKSPEAGGIKQSRDRVGSQIALSAPGVIESQL